MAMQLSPWLDATQRPAGQPASYGPSAWNKTGYNGRIPGYDTKLQQTQMLVDAMRGMFGGSSGGMGGIGSGGAGGPLSGFKLDLGNQIQANPGAIWSSDLKNQTNNTLMSAAGPGFQSGGSSGGVPTLGSAQNQWADLPVGMANQSANAINMAALPAEAQHLLSSQSARANAGIANQGLANQLLGLQTQGQVAQGGLDLNRNMMQLNLLARLFGMMA